MQATAQALPAAAPSRSKVYLPREHGATAMLLTPIFSAALLARTWRWSELAVLAAAFSALAAKDPAVLLIRQRFVWKKRSPDASAATRWLLIWSTVLVASVSVLFATWPLAEFCAIGGGVAAFGGIAVWVNLANRQRSTIFQILSAAALTSTAVATCISAKGAVVGWCWWFWGLSAMQASAGILVVHARLDARIALRKRVAAGMQFRRAAQACLIVLACGAVLAGAVRRPWIAAGLGLAAAGYAYDLQRQKDPVSLQMPLKSVGLQALLLSSACALLFLSGLW